MKSNAFRLATVIIAIQVTAIHAQDWEYALENHFKAIRAGLPARFPRVTIESNERYDALRLLARFASDSNRSVQMQVCDLVHSMSIQSSDADERKAAVDILVDACRSEDPAVMGVALGYLRAFRTSDFTAPAKEHIRSFVTNGSPRLPELVRMAAFLQIDELRPQLWSLTAPQKPSAVRWAALIGLARLGDGKAIAQMMKHVKGQPVNDDVVYNLFPDLVFSRAYEAIAYMVAVIHSDANNCQSADAEKEARIPCAYRVVEQLATVIEGFPVQLDTFGDINTDDYPRALGMVRQWLLRQSEYKLINDRY